MSIEFRCTQCNKLLRTGDDTAGRQAQCPGCGAIGVVPGPMNAMPGAVDAGVMNAAPPEVSPSPSAGEASNSPFAAGPAAPYLQNVENPYRSPSAASELGEQQEEILQAAAMRRVAAPAVALIVVSILGLLMYLVVGGFYGFMIVMLSNGNHPFVPPGQDPQTVFVGCIFWIVVAVVGAIVDIVILVGAIKIRKLENYGLAVTVAVLSLIPCISPGCLVGLPFGIWMLIVLCDNSVRAAFRR